MKLTGCVLIMVGCVAAAMQYLSTQKRQIKTVSELCLALEELKAEIQTRYTPLPEALDKLADEKAGEINGFFIRLKNSINRLGESELSMLWNEAADYALNDIGTDNLSQIKRLGSFLGRFEMAEQANAFDICAAELRNNNEEAKRKLKDNGKICIGLMSCFGILLMIILV